MRTEELLNYFSYDDPAPAQRERPFLTTTEIAPTPWNPHTHLLRIGIKAWEIDTRELPPANLVFLLDVSGSMDSPDKLPLLKRAMSLLSKHLDGDFNVGTVNHQALIDLVERQRGAGIALTTLGFGDGNYNDHKCVATS
ncbi:MAG: von Willebrand factor type A domain-containing protein [Candidatus Sedimenticola endophacoides]